LHHREKSHVSKHCWYICLSSKTIARPWLLVVRSHLLNVVVESEVLAICHKIHNMGSFKKPSLRGGRSLL